MGADTYYRRAGFSLKLKLDDGDLHEPGQAGRASTLYFDIALIQKGQTYCLSHRLWEGEMAEYIKRPYRKTLDYKFWVF